MPQFALANDLWAGPVPLELQDLTEAERIFISRGFTFTQLHTIPAKDAPEHRQKRQQGHTVSFPQNSAQLLNMLPLDVDRAREFLTVYYTGSDRRVVRQAKQYVVRRTEVEAALRWLKVHNIIYVDMLSTTSCSPSCPMMPCRSLLSRMQFVTHTVSIFRRADLQMPRQGKRLLRA